jgi:hypothetical protein
MELLQVTVDLVWLRVVRVALAELEPRASVVRRPERSSAGF